MTGRALLLVLAAPYVVWLVFAYEYHFLDGVNLAFHESGHLFFGLLGVRALTVLGGTLGQLLLPALAVLHFARRQQGFEAWICVLWVGESLMYTGLYMADARALALPLVGGHIHDWNWLFHRFGGLDHAEALGFGVHVVGSLVVIGAFVQAARCALQARDADPLPI